MARRGVQFKGFSGEGLTRDFLSHHHVHVTRYPSDINQTPAAKDGATSSVLSGKPSEV
ncbi:hypothetical protein COLO4_11667 [Corchorus olitorius]|uniref:Uncharacterized protein n=1 Tax=Corchorus olitorius TaxID=93759 RepID=A0A1R3K3M9_9ROSI|nr:hypothetical protein COLO4_11667 [Corchorus olitorius]